VCRGKPEPGRVALQRIQKVDAEPALLVEATQVQGVTETVVNALRTPGVARQRTTARRRHRFGEPAGAAADSVRIGRTAAGRARQAKLLCLASSNTCYAGAQFELP
jgi:hypothetical protein